MTVINYSVCVLIQYRFDGLDAFVSVNSISLVTSFRLLVVFGTCVYAFALVTVCLCMAQNRL